MSGGRCAVWPENWAAARLFLASATQWRVSMAGPVGLDYAGVRAAALALGVPWDNDTLDRLRVMEAEALRLFAAEADRE